MQLKPVHVVVATAIAAALAWGGMSVASAQEDSPGSDSPAADENCPHGASEDAVTSA